MHKLCFQEKNIPQRIKHKLIRPENWKSIFCFLEKLKVTAGGVRLRGLEGWGCGTITGGMGSIPAGWHLNEAGLAKAPGAASAEGGGQGKDKWLLDIDLREDGEAVLPKQFDSLKTPGVFQPALDCIFDKAKSEAAPAQDEGLVLQVIFTSFSGILRVEKDSAQQSWFT